MKKIVITILLAILFLTINPVFAQELTREQHIFQIKQQIALILQQIIELQKQLVVLIQKNQKQISQATVQSTQEQNTNVQTETPQTGRVIDGSFIPAPITKPIEQPKPETDQSLYNQIQKAEQEMRENKEITEKIIKTEEEMIIIRKIQDGVSFHFSLQNINSAKKEMIELCSLWSNPSNSVTRSSVKITENHRDYKVFVGEGISVPKEQFIKFYPVYQKFCSSGEEIKNDFAEKLDALREKYKDGISFQIGFLLFGWVDYEK
jgi:hypothetical protein